MAALHELPALHLLDSALFITTDIVTTRWTRNIHAHLWIPLGAVDWVYKAFSCSVIGPRCYIVLHGSDAKGLVVEASLGVRLNYRDANCEYSDGAEWCVRLGRVC